LPEIWGYQKILWNLNNYVLFWLAISLNLVMYMLIWHMHLVCVT